MALEEAEKHANKEIIELVKAKKAMIERKNGPSGIVDAVSSHISNLFGYGASDAKEAKSDDKDTEHKFGW